MGGGKNKNKKKNLPNKNKTEVEEPKVVEILSSEDEESPKSVGKC